MSRHDYLISIEIAAECYPFYALIMAVMRQADTENAEMLKMCWPHTWAELQRRYNAPAGYLEGEQHGE